MKRAAFKELVAANRRLRRKRPSLRLVVANPGPRYVPSSAAVRTKRLMRSEFRWATVAPNKKWLVGRLRRDGNSYA